MRLAAKGESLQASIFQSVADLDSGLINRWRALELASIDNNAYMSPDFIIPAIKYLTPGIKLFIIVIDQIKNDKTQTIGLGVFEAVKGTKQLPCSFLRAYRSPHSFLTGLLIDKNHTEVALAALLNTIQTHPNRWHAIEFTCSPVETAIDKLAPDILKTKKIRRHELELEERAILIPGNKNQETGKTLSKGTLKNISKRKRLLNELGELKWHFKKGHDITENTIETFLALEDNDWKHEQKTSLNSRKNHRKFFIEKTMAFAKKDKAFFSELELNGNVIASTCNLISGSSGFAFKLGWDIQYAKYGIGILNEYELAQHATQLPYSLNYIDSGTTPGSFIEKVWPERRTLFTGFYTLNTMAAAYLGSTQRIRSIKNYIKQKL